MYSFLHKVDCRNTSDVNAQSTIERIYSKILTQFWTISYFIRADLCSGYSIHIHIFNEASEGDRPSKIFEFSIFFVCT